MRIKWGDQWIECKPDIPIMVELTKKDLENIANMHPDAMKYACFDDSDTTTPEQKIVWMNAGAHFELDSATVMEPAIKPVGPGEVEAYLRELQRANGEKWAQARDKSDLRQWFVGQVMKQFHGKPDPAIVRDLIAVLMQEDMQ